MLVLQQRQDANFPLAARADLKYSKNDKDDATGSKRQAQDMGFGKSEGKGWEAPLCH